MLGSTAFLAMASLASAAAVPRQDTGNSHSYSFLLSGPGYMSSYDFTGTSIKPGMKFEEVGFKPSWLLPSFEKKLLYTNNEDVNDTRVYDFSTGSVTKDAPKAKVNGASGVVTLGFNKEQTRMLGGSYGVGLIDVWDTTPTDTIKHVKTLTLTGPLAPSSTVHRAHEVVLDPTGQFFAVPDLGGDQIVLVDARNENDYKLVEKSINTGTASGPRHGKFIRAGGAKEATHFAVMTETSNEVILYTLKYTDQMIEFTEAQRQSSFPQGVPQPNPPDLKTPAAGGELLVVDDKYVYISNRRTGNKEDTIVSFKLEGDKLSYSGHITTGGTLPRSFHINDEGNLLFVANMAGEQGIQVHARCPSTGTISQTPMATYKRADLIQPQFTGDAAKDAGPQFIMALPRVPAA